MADMRRKEYQRMKDARNSKIVCSHCGKEIRVANILGMGIICPHCGRPADSAGSSAAAASLKDY